jgi:hypothetical protein
MSKAKKIMSLLDEGRSVPDVAQLIGCRPEYVRTVRARASGSRPSDVASSKRLNRLVANVPSSDRGNARSAYRAAYRAAKDSGLSAQQAKVKAHTAYITACRIIARSCGGNSHA